jgi:hypothetical protein
VEKDQPEETRYELNGTDRSRNIDTLMRGLIVFVLWFTVVGVSYLSRQIRNGKRGKMGNDQQAHHDGNRDHPKHAEIADG